MADKELPFGELGDLMESLVPIALSLVQALREEGPDAIRGHLLRVPTDPIPGLENLPGGAYSALALVGFAMVNQDATIRGLLGWTDDLIEPGLAAERQRAIEAERDRLRAAGARSTSDVLAEPVAEQQSTTRTRMLHVVHGGRESA